jgi:hypothetical protein
VRYRSLVKNALQPQLLALALNLRRALKLGPDHGRAMVIVPKATSHLWPRAFG